MIVPPVIPFTPGCCLEVLTGSCTFFCCLVLARLSAARRISERLSAPSCRNPCKNFGSETYLWGLPDRFSSHSNGAVATNSCYRPLLVDFPMSLLLVNLFTTWLPILPKTGIPYRLGFHHTLKVLREGIRFPLPY